MKKKWDFFICHASEDKNAIARPLAAKLSNQFEVWFDEFSLNLGDSLRRAIDNGLKNSKYGIVIFSKNFFAKSWPQKELDGLFAKEGNKTNVIIPVWHKIEKRDIEKYSLILSERVAVHTSVGIEKVINEIIRTVVNIDPIYANKKNLKIDAKEVKRFHNISFGGFQLPIPCFFPSISSIKTKNRPIEYLRVLDSINQNIFLISAYDIYNSEIDEKGNRKRIEKLLKIFINNKETIVLLDSGNYEGYWNKDKSWDNNKFWDVLKSCNFIAQAFCFDKITDDYEKIIKGNSIKRIINEVERRVLEDQDVTQKITINPIVHATHDIFPEVVTGVVERLSPVLVAVPERELGDGIISRAETVFKIRKDLNQKAIDRGGEFYYPLHLLGTGNPLSILIYVLCGADSFDGLEWCQTTVDYETALLYHFQQREFFDNSDLYRKEKIPYDLATWAHNLFFYRNWMGRIQDDIASGKSFEVLNNYFPTDFINRLKRKLPEVFYA